VKIAGCFSRDAGFCRDAAEKMARAQQLFEGQQSECYSLSGGCLGCVTSSERFSNIPLLRRSESGNLLMISGVPLDLHGSLDARLDKILSCDADQASRHLMELDGAFAALFWDAAGRNLAVVTDAMGLQPLYLLRRENLFLLASELKAFPASGQVPIEMDPAGWGAFLSLGHSIGADTQLAGVKRAEPATVLMYDAASGAMTSKTYWSWPKIRENLKLDQIDTDAMIESMKQEIRAYNQHTRKGTVLLSGGFDSRITLAMLCQEKLNPQALILAHQDELWGLDSKLALRSAKRLEVDYTLRKPSRSYYNSPSYLDYLVMNELTTPSLYLFIAQVSSYLESRMEAVWDGTPPGYAFVPAFLSPGGFDVFLRESCLTRQDFGWQVATTLFGRARADEMHDAFSQSLRNEISKYPDNESGIAQFEAFNRMRNRTSPNALKVYSNIAMPCMLGVSRPFWELAAEVPYAASRDYALYFELFRRYVPQVVRVPFLTGGMFLRDRTCGLQGLADKLVCLLGGSPAIQKGQRACRYFLHGSKKYWAESKFLRLTRDRLNRDHSDIDADGLDKLDDQRHLPFYWQMWRWVMSGELTTRNSRTFFGETRD